MLILVNVQSTFVMTVTFSGGNRSTKAVSPSVPQWDLSAVFGEPFATGEISLKLPSVKEANPSFSEAC